MFWAPQIYDVPHLSYNVGLAYIYKEKYTEALEFLKKATFCWMQ